MVFNNIINCEVKKFPSSAKVSYRNSEIRLANFLKNLRNELPKSSSTNSFFVHFVSFLMLNSMVFFPTECDRQPVCQSEGLDGRADL